MQTELVQILAILCSTGNLSEPEAEALLRHLHPGIAPEAIELELLAALQQLEGWEHSRRQEPPKPTEQVL